MNDSTSGVPVLEARGISKRFGAVVALDDVSLRLGHREVLALLGDNGAGKSTLIKVISGVHRPDHGSILIDGAPVNIRQPADARDAGIETVYQDLALFDNLRVDANFYAGRELTTPHWLGSFGLLRAKQMTDDVTAIIERLRVRLPNVSSLVGVLSGGQRQGVAVARAAAFASKIVILDEPTAALGVRESRAVLDLVCGFKDHDISVIIISHNLEHVIEVADRAVVLRRGAVVGEAIPTPENHEQIVSLIVGGGTDGNGASNGNGHLDASDLVAGDLLGDDG